MSVDQTDITVTLFDADVGVIASCTWPDLRGCNPDDPHAEALARSIAQGRFVDWIRTQAPRAEVWFDAAHVAIRQDAAADIVVYAGETLHAIAGQVVRS